MNWLKTEKVQIQETIYLDVKLGISSSFMPDTKYGAESHIF